MLRFIVFLSAMLLLGASGAESKPLQFHFGNGPAPSGAQAVKIGDVYAAKPGWGFEAGAQLTQDANGVVGTKPFFFSAAVPEGNYRVTVDFGNSNQTVIKAEDRRLALEAGMATGKHSFLVNVRRPEIPNHAAVKLKPRETDPTCRTWDDKLTLEFNGASPRVNGITITADPKVPALHIMGDSTVADQSLEPFASWGQMLPRFVADTLVVVNHAQSGDSLRSAAGANRLAKVLSMLRPGDWVMIQYGHNDSKDKSPGAGPFTTYKASLEQFVSDIRAAHGQPILITPVQRRTFGKNGTLLNSHGDYPTAVRQVATEKQVPLIDLHTISTALYEAMGPEASLALFVPKDGTHHNNFGAYQLARCIVHGVGQSKLPITQHFIKETPPFNPRTAPDPAKFTLPASPQATTEKPLGN